CYRKDILLNLWQVNEDTFDPGKLHAQETIYTIGNGYFGTRGTFEEGYLRDNTSTLLFGVFDRIEVGRAELANVPDWLPIKLFVNGERFRLDRGKILGYERILDMFNGVLTRTMRWESPVGAQLSISIERFASLADEHVAAIRYSVTAEEPSSTNETSESDEYEIELRSTLNTAVGNYHLMHWETIDQSDEHGLLWLHSETIASKVQLAQTMSFTAQSKGFTKEIVDSDFAPSIHLSGKLAPGETMTAEKIVVMYTSRDTEHPLRTALAHHHAVLKDGYDNETTSGTDETSAVSTSTPTTPEIHTQAYDALLDAHKAAWHDYWQTADIIIEGDDKAQQAIRYNVYQLRISASKHDDRYSIAAKGLTGFGYRGHIFHDTEIFMLPYFTYVQPEIARNLLLYRYHLLPGARAKAASNGYAGAQYPWESTVDGKEATPDAIIHPESGELVQVLNGSLELHISASIAHAVCDYWSITGDDEFMRDYGAEIVLSTAAFWVSRVTKNDERNDYEINNVIGPDEWHEHVNNNAFTNFMARWNIQKALEILDWLHTTAPDKAHQLAQLVSLNDENRTHWQDVVAQMRILMDKETGLIEQFDGFFKLTHLDQSKYAGRTMSYQGILGMEEIQHYQIVKQADVLMLLTVLNSDLDQKTRRVNWDYYYPITDHDYGSSLTPAFHVILACELGLTAVAYKLYMIGSLVDLENLRGNSLEGIHDACCGAVWQATVLGFAGLQFTEDGYTTHPTWPDNWTRLAFTCFHRGKRLTIDLQK
ncbi:MAG: beta-phosphoglucomutase, partial [Ktedonobacteraceae bacterium]